MGKKRKSENVHCVVRYIYVIWDVRLCRILDTVNSRYRATVCPQFVALYRGWRYVSDAGTSNYSNFSKLLKVTSNHVIQN
jgi:hypothetical protein